MNARALITLLPVLAAMPAGAQDSPPYGYAGQPSGYTLQKYDADGQSVDSVDVFYAPLSRSGRWIDSRYGRVWSPNVGRDWRPYTIGHWENGRYGQTWRSDEPFGWAAFHFGRWAFDPAIGWVWLPDTTWGPGWVAWRDSDDVVGWAPLPPQIGLSFGFGSGFGFNDWGYDQWYQPAWVYVPRGYLYNYNVRGVVLDSRRGRDFWDRTRGVTRYDRVDGQWVNRSFGGDTRRDYSREPRWNGGRNVGRDGRHDVARDLGRDQRRDAGIDPRRDGRQPDLRNTQPSSRGAVPGYVPFQPNAQLDASTPAARDFDRRDGYARGAPQPRPVVRGDLAPPAAIVAPRAAVPRELAPVARSAAPAATPRMEPARPAPPLRERNPDERPR